MLLYFLHRHISCGRLVCSSR